MGCMAEERCRNLADRVADDMVQLISENGYSAGERLPTEKELCQLFCVGRNTLREALKLLASRNIVTIRQGAGTFIAQRPGVIDDPFGFSLAPDRKKLTKDLLQVRVMIEPPIAALAAQCATAQDVKELEEILIEMESVMNKKKDYSHLDMAFHQKIAESTHNAVMGNLVPIIGNGVSVFSTEVEKTEYKQTLLSHRSIFEHITNHRCVEAEMEMRYHLLYNIKRYENENL